MLAGERHKKIVEAVNMNGTVRVSELGRLFGVTDETIRRDLERLEHQGKLLRTHGGALALKREDEDLPHFQREVLNRKEKMDVAREAVKYIAEKDIIFLDASSTALYLARLIPNIPLTVLTNSVQVCAELTKNSSMQVICTGGTLSPNSQSFVGPLTLKTLESYYVDKFFFSCQGLHAEWGISDSNELQALVKQKMMERAETKYLLMDHTKLGKKAFAHIGYLEEIDVLIVDDETDDHHLKPIEEMGVEIRKSGSVRKAI